MKPGCLFMQYEGMNPSGSFKDNGMTAAFTLVRDGLLVLISLALTLAAFRMPSTPRMIQASRSETLS